MIIFNNKIQFKASLINPLASYNKDFIYQSISQQ